MFQMRSANPTENFVVKQVLLRGVSYASTIEDLMIHMEIYESLDGLTSGLIQYRDSIGAMDTVRINGLEAIDVQFASLVGDKIHRMYNKQFRVTGVTRVPSGSGGFENIMIRFSNNLLAMNDFVKRPYVFKKLSISTIIKNILDSTGLSSDYYEIEDSLYQRDFVTPITRPFATIKSIMNFASTDVSNSCKFLFYEDRDKIRFRSMGTIRSQPYTYLIRKGADTGDGKWTSGDTNIITALRIVVKEQSDVKRASSGIFGSRTYSHSLIRKKLTTSDVRRSDYISNVGILNDKAYMYEDQSDFESEVLESEQPLNSIQLVPGDGFYENDTKHTLGSIHGVSLMEETFMSCKSLMVEIPGNTNITVGDVIYIDYHSPLGDKISSKDVSGKWIVHDLKHRIEKTKFVTTLEVHSDSSVKIATSGSSK